MSYAGDNNAAADALSSAVNCAANANIASRIPQDRYLQCAKLLLYAGRIPASLAVSIAGQQVYTSSSLALVAAICLLRSDRLSDAEVALRDANLLDNRNAEVWAYQCLVCLGTGYHRLKEAEAALNQALRLGLSASPVLRELGTAFISVDKLQTAEDLIRRALSAEGGKGSPYTRKLLGDVLAGQQQAARAIDEYQVILGDETDSDAGLKLKVEAAQQCRALLVTLGRTEELVAIDAIIESLHQQ
jgi:Flp pilus assembly protein TadD